MVWLGSQWRELVPGTKLLPVSCCFPRWHIDMHQALFWRLSCMYVDSFNPLKHHNVHQHIKGSEVSSNQKLVHLCPVFLSFTWRWDSPASLWRGRVEGTVSVCVHFRKLLTGESSYSNFASSQTQVWDMIYFQNGAESLASFCNCPCLWPSSAPPCCPRDTNSCFCLLYGNVDSKWL